MPRTRDFPRRRRAGTGGGGHDIYTQYTTRRTHLNGIGGHNFAVELLGQPYAELRLPRACASDNGEQRPVLQKRIHAPAVAVAVRAKCAMTRAQDPRILGRGGVKRDGIIIAFQRRENQLVPNHNITSNALMVVIAFTRYHAGAPSSVLGDGAAATTTGRR